MKRLVFAAVIVAASSAELSPATPQRARRERPARCLAVRVGPADGEEVRGRREAAFSAAETADLRFEVWIHERYSSEPVTVKLFTPRDKLYQVLTVGAEGAPAKMSLRSRGRSRRSHATLAAEFPVGGTHVTTYALYGEWRAEAYIGDVDSPCAPPLRFEIEP